MLRVAKFFGIVLFVVGLPGLLDDISGWGKWLERANLWIKGNEMLAVFSSINRVHYALLGIGILLLVPWQFLGKKLRFGVGVKKFSSLLEKGFELNNRWQDRSEWSSEWYVWNGQLTSCYSRISKSLATAKEINIHQAERKYGDYGVDGRTQPKVDRAMLAERLKGLQEYIDSKVRR